MPLTDAYIKGIKPLDTPKKYFDGGGLYLFVQPTGSKRWKLTYRFEKKQNTLSFGEYPTVSLKEAREKREEAKKLLDKGINPSAHKKAVRFAVHAETHNTLSWLLVLCNTYSYCAT